MAGRRWLPNRFFVAAALTAALLLAACGDDSAEPAAQLKASTETVSPQVAETPAGAAEPAQASGKADEKAASAGDRKANDRAHPTGTVDSDPAQPTASKTPNSGSRHGAGAAQPKAGGKSKGKAKKPKQPKATESPLPPEFAGQSIYEVARQMCSDPQILDLIPEEQRDSPEQLAEMARSFAPPGEGKAAYDGCLAGLHEIGL